MNLDELVQAAIAKALADYIETRATVDEGFLGKLADMVAERVEAQRVRREQEEARRRLNEQNQMYKEFWEKYFRL